MALLAQPLGNHLVTKATCNMLGNRCFLGVRYCVSIFTLVWLLANFPLIGYRRYKEQVGGA